MSLTTDQARTLAGAGGNVVSTDGGKIGGIGQIYLDDSTGSPTWVTAKTGLFGTKESFVPLEGATVSGDDVVVSYDKDKVKDAPRVDPDGSLSPEEEGRYAHPSSELRHLLPRRRAVVRRDQRCAPRASRLSLPADRE